MQARIGFDDPLFHRREMTLLASRNSCNDFPRIIRLIEAGRIDTTPWITHRLSLSSVPEEFAALGGQSDLVKAMIERRFPQSQFTSHATSFTDRRR